MTRSWALGGRLFGQYWDGATCSSCSACARRCLGLLAREDARSRSTRSVAWTRNPDGAGRRAADLPRRRPGGVDWVRRRGRALLVYALAAQCDGLLARRARHARARHGDAQACSSSADSRISRRPDRPSASIICRPHGGGFGAGPHLQCLGQAGDPHRRARVQLGTLLVGCATGVLPAWCWFLPRWSSSEWATTMHGTLQTRATRAPDARDDDLVVRVLLLPGPGHRPQLLGLVVKSGLWRAAFVIAGWGCSDGVGARLLARSLGWRGCLIQSEVRPCRTPWRLPTTT